MKSILAQILYNTLGSFITKTPVTNQIKTKRMSPTNSTNRLYNIDTNIEGKNQKKNKIVENKAFAYCILAMFMSYKQKSLQVENYIKAKKLAPLNENQRNIFEQNYIRAIKTVENYNKHYKNARKYCLKMPKLLKIYNKVYPADCFNFKKFKSILTRDINLNLKASFETLKGARPLYTKIINPALRSLEKFEAVKNNPKVSNIYALVEDVCIKGSSIFFVIKNPRSIVPVLVPLFTVATVMNFAKSFVFSGQQNNSLIKALDSDIVTVGKNISKGIVFETFVNCILLPELRLVEKYPFFKPILFAKPIDILETSNQVVQLYKDHCEKEFLNNVKVISAIANKPNNAVICSEPKTTSICADKPNDDYIANYVI